MNIKIKKIYLFITWCLLFFMISSNVIATSGALRSGSIVTCNGITYGSHSDHWHQAKQASDGKWMAADPNNELQNNPCNNSSESTNDEKRVQESKNNADIDNQSNASSSATQKEKNTKPEEIKTTEVVELKIWIDNGDNPIIFKDNSYTAKSRNYWQKDLNFTYQLSSENVSLKVEKNGEQIDGPIELDEGENNIKIIVKSDNGEDATFEINVKREKLFASLAVMVITCTVLVVILGVSASAIKVYIIDPKKKKKNKKPSTREFMKSLLKKENCIKILLPPFYIAKEENKNKKTSDYFSCWLAIWFITIVAVILSFMNNPVKSDTNINLTNSPSATFTIELTKTSESKNKTEESEGSPETSSNDIMSGIIVAEATNAQYSRNEYQPNWNVGSGCNIRARILQQASIVAVKTASNGCTVIYGSWVDPYTGKTLTGNPYQGDDGTSNDLDIDHIIPLKYVNSHGGSEWSNEQKRAYGSSLSAMDKGVYVAVSASENRKKGDSGPSKYYPPNESYKCEYAEKWRDIAKEYSISLSLNDYNTILNVLISCAV